MTAGYTSTQPSLAGEDAKLGEEEDLVDKDDAADIAHGVASSQADSAETDELPELLDLLDEIEESGEDAELLASLLLKVSRRIRATPNDRDLLTDFEGISNICKRLAAPPHEWRGEAMLVFCKIMPEVCRSSNVNRGSLRDEGFLSAAVELLRFAVTGDGDEPVAIAACTALSATCTANDGNKKVAAQLIESTSERPGGMLLCLDALGKFPESPQLQTEALCALRTLFTDDDSRKSASEPSAVENREVALSDDGFPFLGIAVERALNLADATEKPLLRLREQALLLLREMARRQDFVKTLALDAKLLPRVQATLKLDDARVVRASLSVMRAFCAVEEVRDEIGLMSDGAYECIVAVQKHLGTPVVCEQGFGLFANLTIRKSPIAAKLNEGERSIVSVAKQVMLQHASRADVMRQVVQSMRNVAMQDEAASTEMKECDIFEHVRQLVKEHEGDARWHATVDISRQFLREFREDAGMEKKAVYNKFY
jgi:hypothetical protein